MAPGGAALLRQACRVLGDDAASFQVACHTQQLTDGDDARAAHTCHHNAVAARVDTAGERWHFGHGQIAQRQRIKHRAVFALFAQLATFNRDKAGAKAFDTTLVFVTGALVDGALATKISFKRLHTQAIALGAAVAAALAHRLIDDDTNRRVDHGAALPAAAFFGGTGLVVNDDGAACYFSHHALNCV